MSSNSNIDEDFSGAYLPEVLSSTTPDEVDLYCHETFDIPRSSGLLSVDSNHPSIRSYVTVPLADEEPSVELAVGDDDGRLWYTYSFKSKNFSRVCNCNTCIDLQLPERNLHDTTSDSVSIDRLYYHV